MRISVPPAPNPSNHIAMPNSGRRPKSSSSALRRAAELLALSFVGATACAVASLATVAVRETGQRTELRDIFRHPIVVELFWPIVSGSTIWAWLWGVTFFSKRNLGTEWIGLLLIPILVAVVTTLLFHAPIGMLAGLFAVPLSCLVVSKRIDGKAAAANAE